MKRLIVVVAALAGALLLQLTIVNGLPLPGGGVPDLVLLCVVAVGLIGGREPGLIVGFCAGLALDLAPPSNELIGQYALAFCLVGYASGRLKFTLRQSVVLALAAAAAAAVIGEVIVGVLAVVLDTPEVTLAAVLASLPSAVLYDLVLMPLVMFAGVRIAIALGVNFNALDDSPALETGGSAQPMGPARLARMRLGRHPIAGDGIGAAGSWLTGDSAAGVPAMGAVGWLSGPATSRRARREQARLSAAVAGAAPRKGAVWVGSRPAGLVPDGPRANFEKSGLSKLKPGSGMPGSALRQGAPMALPTGSNDRRVGGAPVPKIAFGTGGPLRQHAPEPGVPKIAFGTGGLLGADRPGAGRPGAGRAGAGRAGAGRAGAGRPSAGRPGAGRPAAGRPGVGRPGGQEVPKIAFGTGSLPGAGRAAGRKVPKIAFGAGLPRGPRTSPGRPALPRFRSGSGSGLGAGRSAAGPWLAVSRLRSGQFGAAGRGRHPTFSGGARSYLTTRSYRPKTAKWRRRGRYRRWLPFARRAGGRSAVWRITSKIGGER